MIPYGGVYQFGESTVSLVAADIDWGLLYVFAVGSLATYGAVLAGWASNSNWSILGALRNTAQMISYEVTMGLSVVGIFMVFGTLRLTDMAVTQDSTFRPAARGHSRPSGPARHNGELSDVAIPGLELPTLLALLAAACLLGCGRAASSSRCDAWIPPRRAWASLDRRGSPRWALKQEAHSCVAPESRYLLLFYWRLPATGPPPGRRWPMPPVTDESWAKRMKVGSDC